MVSSPYFKVRRHFQSSILSSRDDKLCGAGRNNLAVQSSSHFCVDLSFVLPWYDANRPCKHVRLQAAVHACKNMSLKAPNSFTGNRNPCNMSINFVGFRCTACIHASIPLRSRGISVYKEEDLFQMLQAAKGRHVATLATELQEQLIPYWLDKKYGVHQVIKVVEHGRKLDNVLTRKPQDQVVGSK